MEMQDMIETAEKKCLQAITRAALVYMQLKRFFLKK